MKKGIVIVVTAMILFCSTVSRAQTTGSIILEDALYGGIIGTLVGGAFLAFSDDPGDNLDYLAKGAAVGVIAGMLFGVYETTAFATIDDGKLRFAMPTIKTRVIGNTRKKIQGSIDIVKIKF
jgi:hypothetical protein